MNYVLLLPLTEDDINFLNTTNIEFEIVSKFFVKNKDDSGWCDMDTGARIINSTDRAVFNNVSQSDLTLLKLKYYNRLEQLQPLPPTVNISKHIANKEYNMSQQ